MRQLASTLLIGLLLAGCGANNRATHPTASRASSQARTPAGGCAQHNQVTRIRFAAWRMGAIQFFSPTSGIGITAKPTWCLEEASDGTHLAARAQGLALARTTDGGRSWHTTGQPTPGNPRPWFEKEIVARTATSVLALLGNEGLMATTDGGAHWSRQLIPGPVVHIAASRNYLWAVACPHAPTSDAPDGCRPELWRASSINARWTRTNLAAVKAAYPESIRIAVTPTSMIIALPQATARAKPELLTSTDQGQRWTTSTAPRWARQPCNIAAAVAAYGPRTFWLLCVGGAAAGSSTKGLLRSTDAGRTWHTVSAATSLTRPSRPRSISLQEPNALAAGSQTELWLSLVNGFAESNDAGHYWTDVPSAFDPDGVPAQIDTLNASHAWLLAPGVGLWRTTAGRQWRADGPLHTGLGRRSAH